MKRDFDEIMNDLKISIADYSYYTDFAKVFKNVEKYKIELNILNSLIGSKNIEIDFLAILNKYPDVLKIIPLLIAVRKHEIEIIDGQSICFNFKDKNLSDDMYVKFMRDTGLFHLLETGKLKCLKDYLLGVEVGLDTNARKNRTGKAMEKIVERVISNIPNIEYNCELNKKDINNKYGIDLVQLLMDNLEDEDGLDEVDKHVLDTMVSEKIKDAEKRFDFVVRTDKKLYLIETNFYGSQGSKLNETARSYKSLSRDIKKLKDIDFIWITDGIGWKSARANLKETYDIMDHFYTLKDLEDGKLEKLFREE